MLLIEEEIDIAQTNEKSLLRYFERKINELLPKSQIPVRFAVTNSEDENYHIELGVLTDTDIPKNANQSLFRFVKRKYENTDKFNAVLLVPTGIGAEIGGHAGDAAPVARMMAAACDTLITHPNVVNASDINELPENGLYVEGSVISNMLMGTMGLQKVRANRMMLVMEKNEDRGINEWAINAVSAARAALGVDCFIVEVDPTAKMRARFSNSGSAVGRVEGLERICEVIEKHRDEFDAVALASVIDVPHEFHTEYFEKKGEMINPWGGVEAMLTHTITMLYGIPAAHSPMFESTKIANLDVGVVDPRMSAEAISLSFLHCILKGLHKSPRIISDREAINSPGVLSAKDISCVVIPEGCLGLPTLAAMEQGIPVIAVRENKNLMRNDLGELAFKDGKYFVAENYPEAVGIMMAIKAGVPLPAVHRPLKYTDVVCESFEKDNVLENPTELAGSKEN